MNPYKILGIDDSATDEEVKRAYRKMAMKYHPDAGGDAWAFEQVREAYDSIVSIRNSSSPTSQPSSQPKKPTQKARPQSTHSNSADRPNPSGSSQSSGSSPEKSSSASAKGTSGKSSSGKSSSGASKPNHNPYAHASASPSKEKPRNESRSDEPSGTSIPWQRSLARYFTISLRQRFEPSYRCRQRLPFSSWSMFWTL